MFPKILAIFFIAHGLVHAGLAAAPIPNDPNPKPGDFFTAAVRSWLLPKLGFQVAAIRWVGIGLVVLATIAFISTGLGIFGVQGLNSIWRTTAVAGAGGSLLLLLVFWHPWLIVGVTLDIVILISLLWLDWPPKTLFGA